MLASFQRKMGKNKRFLADVRRDALWGNKG